MPTLDYGELTVLEGAYGADPDVDNSTVFEWDADAGGSDVDNQVLFAGYRHDPETGLYHVRHRYHHLSLGRWITRDPISYVDGMNMYEYVENNPMLYVDHLGLWKRVSREHSNVWCAESGDSLSSLAAKAEYGGNPMNWPCLWPVGDTEDHGYPDLIWPGDTYDASNLYFAWGPWVYINMDTEGPIGKVYKEDRPLAYPAPTGLQVYERLKSVSHEGNTPIDYFEFLGHSDDWPGIGAGDKTNKKITKKGGARADFYPRDYTPDMPTPTFERAKDRKGPHRCWFTRSATGYSFACAGEAFARDFAGSFLRQGASIKTSPHGVTVYNRNRWFHQNTWRFENESPSNIDDFLKSTRWVTINGAL